MVFIALVQKWLKNSAHLQMDTVWLLLFAFVSQKHLVGLVGLVGLVEGG
jgi:hypothetical protein